MSEKLKPCPFCGGVANIIDHHNDDGSVSVGCNDDECLGFAGLGWLYRDKAEAVKAWNTRAERTCRAIPNREWVATPECGVDCHTCSECGKVLYYDANEDCPCYCPNCGAKVVER